MWSRGYHNMVKRYNFKNKKKKTNKNKENLDPLPYTAHKPGSVARECRSPSILVTGSLCRGPRRTWWVPGPS